MGMGYQGYAKFYVDERGGNGDEKDSVVVLTTGASVNLVLEPIYSTGVWGAGWYNAAESAHYADNAIRYEGNIDTELQVGTLGKYWNLIQDFAIAHRAYPKSLEISPDGEHVYKYLIKDKEDGQDVTINSPESFSRDSQNYTHGAYCTSINFATSTGQVVTSSVGIVAIYRDESDPAGGNSYRDYAYIKQVRGVVGGDTKLVEEMAPLNPDATNVNPIPYWRTNAKLFCSRDKNKANGEGPKTIEELFNIGGASNAYVPQSDVETVEWNVDVNNNQQILYTCCGTRMPRAVLMGPMSVSGAVTLFSDQGVFDPVLGPDPSNPHTVNNQYMAAENTWFNVAIEADNGRYVYISVPAVVVESDDYSIQSADSVTNRAFNIKGLGGRCINNDDYLGSFVLPPCVMSRYYTAGTPTSADILAVPWSYTGSSYDNNPSGYEAAPAPESSSGD